MSRRRLLLAAAILVVVVVVAALPPVHALALRAVTAAETAIRSHSAWGALAFVALSALSAMLAFFSSTVFIPVAIRAWGAGPTMGLLWLGWLVGGIAAYAIGSGLGRRVVLALVNPARVRYYGRRVSAHLTFPRVLLFQFALPSELPGYLLGIARYPLAKYLLALGIAELPYAVTGVLLGTQFLERQYLPMAGVGLVALVAVAWGTAQLRRRLHTSPKKPSHSMG